ncbi:hypothetical protein ID866_8715 [Astraeus odoratus]|nr:hypothetical protein ID866_8715 [Astraeus odoratus]
MGHEEDLSCRREHIVFRVSLVAVASGVRLCTLG